MIFCNDIDRAFEGICEFVSVLENIKFTIAYDGTDFHGFQYQPQLRTVEGVLQSTFEKILKHPVVIEGSGRTDAGVHARAQAITVKVQEHIPIEKWPLALNVR